MTPSSSVRQPNDSLFQQLWALTTGNCPQKIDAITSENNNPRKVHFHASVKVILIPSREEYVSAKLIKTLWWERDCYPLFKLSAVKEVLLTMQGNNTITCKEAMKLLYQTSESTGDNIERNSEAQIMPINDKKDMNGMNLITINQASESSGDNIESLRDDPNKKDMLLNDNKHINNFDKFTTKSPQSCLKDTSNIDLKRPINLSISEYGRKPIQKHLHPLAYMCETFVSY